MTSKAVSLELRHRCNRPLSDVLAALLHAEQPQHPLTPAPARKLLGHSHGAPHTHFTTRLPHARGRFWGFFFCCFVLSEPGARCLSPRQKTEGAASRGPELCGLSPGQRHLRPGGDRGDPGGPPPASPPSHGGSQPPPHPPQPPPDSAGGR